ncbi:MAG: DUF721 domain-containing protein [Synergistaceae bacterium]|nr:DUF721 domain-containing protein [Synergistaceae bacterium]
MNDEKINLDVTKLFPEVARRMQILDELKKLWPSIVGIAAKYSSPYDLIHNDLYVEVKNQQTAQMIQNMRGNITRAFITRYKYDKDSKINVIIKRPNVEKAKIKPAPVKKQAVKIDDSLVNEYMSECPESLPQDVKFAISHLRAYLEAIGSQSSFRA